MPVCLCNYSIQGDVPVVTLYQIRLLQFMGDAYQFWFAPSVSGGKVGEGSVIKARAHTNSVSSGIKCNQWHQHQIQRPGGDRPASANIGFNNAVSVFN